MASKNGKKNILMLDIFFILAGSALVAFGLSVFTVPNDIAPGGVSGIATALSHILGLRVGMLSLILNIPLMIIGWRMLGFGPVIKTIAATILLSIFIDLFAIVIPPYVNNVLLSSLMGGVITGAGLGCLMIRGISTGGSDLVSLMVYKHNPNLSMGQILMLIDTTVVIFATIVFGEIEVALYSMVTIVVATKTVDIIQQGVDNAKVIYIVTDKQEIILHRLANEMGRGVTLLPAKGGFTGKNKAVLMTIARRTEVFSTLRAIRELDPRAFTILSNACAVYGEGFKD